MDYNQENEDGFQDEGNIKLQSNFSNSGQVKHRRKKNEIEKDYICGDSNCGRRYGTNAALYTHIKNKHGGVAPNGTVKPSSSQKKISLIQQENQSGDHSQNDQPQPVKQKIIGNHKEEEEKSQILDIMSNPSFNQFSFQIGKMGAIDGDNLLVRDSNEEYYIIKEDQVQEFYNEILQKIQMSQAELEQSNFLSLSNIALQFLVQTSPYWKKNSIKELYLFLIYSYVYDGHNFDRFVEELQNQNDKYPVFIRLLQGTQRTQISSVYENVWKCVNVNTEQQQ